MNALRLLVAAAIAATVYPALAAAATSDALEITAPEVNMVGTPLIEHQLDVEITVRNWILCASQPFAETLVHAREQSPDAAAKTFAELEAARSCGRFAEMQVILQKNLYDALLPAGKQAKIFGALIYISGAWASGYVVYGAIPEK